MLSEGNQTERVYTLMIPFIKKFHKMLTIKILC